MEAKTVGSRPMVRWSLFVVIGLATIFITIRTIFLFQETMTQRQNEYLSLNLKREAKIASLSARITELTNEDLRKTNEAMAASVSSVNKTFVAYATLLEKISDAKVLKIDVLKQEAQLPKIIRLLADLKWSEGQRIIIEVQSAVEKALADSQIKTVAAGPPAVESQSLPAGDGLSKQSVKTDRGTFTVTLIVSDLSSTRILTDSASENDCVDTPCPTKSLADYVSTNGGFAGINGSYFCPPDYAQCTDKEGSFGTLVFNARLRKYINSDNNKFSTVPMFVQTGDHGMRFMGQTVDWGRDTGINGGLANYPLLVAGGQAATSDEGGAGGRNFIGVKSGKVYIGHVHGANFAQAAAVLATLGMENALNLDTGGSTAIYYNGRYILGPGRLIPNAIILAR